MCFNSNKKYVAMDYFRFFFYRKGAKVAKYQLCVTLRLCGEKRKIIRFINSKIKFLAMNYFLFAAQMRYRAFRITGWKLFVLIFQFVVFSACAQERFADELREGRAIRLGFYNVENLFHPDNDSLTNDDAFTPEGQYRWTEFRLAKKVEALAKVIRNMGGWEAIEVLGMCEVENRQVLEQLVRHPILKNAGYRILHRDSPDRRGIDVAAIYRPDVFDLLHWEAVKVLRDDDTNFRTRDIVYIKGLALEDTLHIFFNHWPSRYGGQLKSEPSRFAAAKRLRSKVDSILATVPLANIVILGDFNDEWDNKSLIEHLGAGAISNGKYLVNLMAEMSPDFGTHKFNGRWSYLDQAIITRNMLDTANVLNVLDSRAEVFQADYLLERDEKYTGKKPFRMFIGMKYNGGFSDHLPIYLDLVK